MYKPVTDCTEAFRDVYHGGKCLHALFQLVVLKYSKIGPAELQVTVCQPVYTALQLWCA